MDWQPDIAGVAELEDRHQRATRFALAWLRLTSRHLLTEGIVSIWEGPIRRFEVRQTSLDFGPKRNGDHGGLPEWVLLDDEPRYFGLRSPPLAYLLVNSRRTALLATCARPHTAAMWKRKKMWVPRYNDWETVLLAPRKDCEIRAIKFEDLANPFDETTPTD